MILNNYGIKLVRLTEDKIEMVRRWRNDAKISKYMEYREAITPEMQAKWFYSINNNYNYYFFICIHDLEIGLINIKEINADCTEGEGGVFIYDDKYLNTDVAYRAHLVLFDYFFYEKNFDRIISHVLVDNERAIRFTQYLGFYEESGQEGVYNRKYVLKKTDYIENVNRLRFLKKWNKYKQIQLQK